MSSVVTNGRHSQTNVLKSFLTPWRKHKQVEDFFRNSMAFAQKGGASGEGLPEFDPNQYLAEFERVVKEAANAGCLYSENVLAFKLLEHSQLVRGEADVENFFDKVFQDGEKILAHRDNGTGGQSSLRFDGILASVKSFVAGFPEGENMDDSVANGANASSNVNQNMSTSHPKMENHEGHNLVKPDLDSADYKMVVKYEHFNSTKHKGTVQDDHHDLNSNLGGAVVDDDSSDEGKRAVKMEAGLETNKEKRKAKPKEEDHSDQLSQEYSIEESNPDGTHTCVECLFRTNEKWVLTIHLKEKHHYTQRSMVECEECSAIYSGKAALKIHIKNAHGDKITKAVTCTICDYQFSSANHLLMHQETVHGTGSYQCEDCGKSFPSANRFRYHNFKVHNKRISFAKKKNLKTYWCEVCEKTLYSHNTLKKHRDKHSGKDTSKICDLCGNTYANKSSLAQHMITAHSEKPRYACQKCDYIAHSTETLYAHVTLKHEGKKLPCPLCDFEATSLFYLHAHKRTHRTEDDKRLESAPKNPNNIRRTKPKKPKSTVKRPPTEGYKAYRAKRAEKVNCDMCDNFFGTRDSLWRHKAADHFGKMRFECDQCDYVSKEKNNLKAHIQRKHSGLRFPCAVCKSTFSDEFAMKTHMRRKHGILPTSDVVKETLESVLKEEVPYNAFQP